MPTPHPPSSARWANNRLPVSRGLSLLRSYSTWPFMTGFVHFAWRICLAAAEWAVILFLLNLRRHNYFREGKREKKRKPCRSELARHSLRFRRFLSEPVAPQRQMLISRRLTPVLSKGRFVRSRRACRRRPRPLVGGDGPRRGRTRMPRRPASAPFAALWACCPTRGRRKVASPPGRPRWDGVRQRGSWAVF